jgi:hypothetical protein
MHEAQSHRPVDANAGLLHHLPAQRLDWCLALLEAPSRQDVPFIGIADGQDITVSKDHRPHGGDVGDREVVIREIRGDP